MTYLARRYRYKDDRLEKNFDGDQDGWFKTKEEALDAATKPEAKPEAPAVPRRRKKSAK